MCKAEFDPVRRQSGEERAASPQPHPKHLSSRSPGCSFLFPSQALIRWSVRMLSGPPLSLLKGSRPGEIGPLLTVFSFLSPLLPSLLSVPGGCQTFLPWGSWGSWVGAKDRQSEVQGPAWGQSPLQLHLKPH